MTAIRKIGHCVSFTLMGIGIAVLAFEGLVYNVVFLGRILPALGKDKYVVPFAVLFNLVWILAVWSCLQAYRTNPGSVPTRWRDFVEQVGDEMHVVLAQPEWQPGVATHCWKCPTPRPERTKHCKICDICVLRMDHHCPWINNCVGFSNHKYFILLGVYSGLASVIAVGTAFPELLLCSAMLLYMVEDVILASGNEDVNLDVPVVTAFFLFGGVALLALVLLVLLLSQHLPLAMQNTTCVEQYYKNMPNPFDQGSITANLAQIFGAVGPDWLLPISPRRPLTDGVSFERFDDSFGLPDGGLSACTSFLQPEQIWRQRFNVHSGTAEPLENVIDVMSLAAGKCGQKCIVQRDAGPGADPSLLGQLRAVVRRQQRL